MKWKKINMEEEISLDEAWRLVGQACYVFENKKVRLALMIIQDTFSKTNRKLTRLIQFLEEQTEISKNELEKN